MVEISIDIINEIKKLYVENNSIGKTARKLGLQFYAVCKIVDTERWLRVYNKRAINSRVKAKSDYVKPLNINPKIVAKRVNKIKQEAIEWIKKYYVESDANNYPLQETYKDYEYHCLNPVVHEMLTKSGYVKALLECGFTRLLKVVKTNRAHTPQGLFNLERRH